LDEFGGEMVPLKRRVKNIGGEIKVFDRPKGRTDDEEMDGSDTVGVEDDRQIRLVVAIKS